MARIAGVNLPLNKRSEIGLTYIYGIGRSTSNKILKEVGVSPDTYVRDLPEDEVAKLRERTTSSITTLPPDLLNLAAACGAGWSRSRAHARACGQSCTSRTSV